MPRTMTKAELEAKLYWYRATVVKVVDGDTIDLMVQQGLHGSQEERFRWSGIDAWEVRGVERPEGLKAKARVLEILEGKEYVWIQTVKSRRGDKQGKYGRFLADVYVEMDEEGVLVNLNDLLVEEGHAEKVNY